MNGRRSGGNTGKADRRRPQKWDLWSVAIRTSISWSGRGKPRRHDDVPGKRLGSPDCTAEGHAGERAWPAPCRIEALFRWAIPSGIRPTDGRMAARRRGLPETYRAPGFQQGVTSPSTRRGARREGGATGRELPPRVRVHGRQPVAHETATTFQQGKAPMEFIGKARRLITEARRDHGPLSGTRRPGNRSLRFIGSTDASALAGESGVGT